MEELEKIEDRVTSEKFSQRSPEKQIQFVDIVSNIQLRVDLYFIDKIKFTFHSREIDLTDATLNVFLQSIKNEVVLYLIGLQDIQVKVIVPFLKTVLSDLSPEKAQERSENLRLIFSSGFDSDCLSINKLQLFIKKLEQTTDNDFKLDLKALGLSKKYEECSSFKASLIEAYKVFFEITNQCVVKLQKLLATFSVVDLDHYIISLEKYFKENDQQVQERFINECIRMHTFYPQYCQELSNAIHRIILSQSTLQGETTNIINGRKFVVPKYEERIQVIDLLQVIREVKEEGLFPAHVQRILLLPDAQKDLLLSMVGEAPQKNEKQRFEVGTALQERGKLEPTDEELRRFLSTLEYFSKYCRIQNTFRLCSADPHYDNKSEKSSALEKVSRILNDAKTVDDYNAAFYLIAPYINRHKHARWDSFFGNKITKTWNKVIRQIREAAISALLNELNDILDIDDKITMLKKACKLPLFNQHRNNHWYTGAFGDTHAVGLIKKEIANLEEQKKQPRLSL